MTDAEQKLLEALLELEQTVAAMPTAHSKPDLRPFFSRIDELAHQLPPQIDPSLRHYLQKKSYEKARLFLQGRDADNPPGQCGHLG